MFDVATWGALVATLSLASFASAYARRISQRQQQQVIVARMRHR